jgi:DHA2 family multidrug resistance protein
MFNVIRQLGGSFGVAVIGTLLSRRIVYHTAMYGQAVDQTLPAVKQVSFALRQFAQGAVGGPNYAVAQRANAMIISHIGQQAFVRSVDDAFLFAAAITCLGVVPVFVLRTHKKKKGKAAHEHAASLE